MLNTAFYNEVEPRRYDCLAYSESLAAPKIYSGESFYIYLIENLRSLIRLWSPTGNKHAIDRQGIRLRSVYEHLHGHFLIHTDTTLAFLPFFFRSTTPIAL